MSHSDLPGYSNYCTLRDELRNSFALVWSDASSSAVYLQACGALDITVDSAVMLCLESESTVVDLSRAYMFPGSVIALSLALPKRVHTESLVLGPQQIDSALLGILCDGLKNVLRLRSLDLTRNPIGSLGIESVIRLARVLPQLRHVNVDDVEMVPSVYRKLQRVLSRP